jgi:hypothetical protein
MKRHQRVDHGAHGHQGKEAGGDATDGVAEVEEADGETAEDDGEVEPGEEGALVGEEDFGFDAGGEGDALSCMRAMVRMTSEEDMGGEKVKE